MPQIPFRYNESLEEKIEAIPGNTKNGKLNYLVENYDQWHNQLKHLKKENLALQVKVREMESLMMNKYNADKNIDEYVKKLRRKDISQGI